MSKKNKKNHPIQFNAPTPGVKEELDDHVHRLTINVDKTVHKLLTRTAERNKLDIHVLVDLSVQAMLGSLESYGYDPMKMDIGEIKPAKGSIEGPSLFLSEYTTRCLEQIAVFFGVRMCDILQDSILSQRFNWQRMQPVNARSMSSIRLQMFEQEQLGPR